MSDQITDRFVPALSATSDMPDSAPDTAAAESEANTPKSEEIIDPAAAAEQETAPEGVLSSEAVKEGSMDDGGEAPSEPIVAEPKGVGKALKARDDAIAAERARAALAEERAAKAIQALEALAARLPVPQEAPEATEEPKPIRENFDSPDAYDQALIEYAGRKAAKDARAELAEENRKSRAESEARAAEDQRQANLQKQIFSWQEREAKVAEEFPDYAEVARADNLPISQVMAEAMMEADNGPQVAYHLGKNPTEAKRIWDLPPAKQIFEIGRISDRLARPKVEVSKAPPPIKPIRQSNAAATEKSYEEMSMDEFAAKRNAQILASKRRPGQPSIS